MDFPISLGAVYNQFYCIIDAHINAVQKRIKTIFKN